MNKCFMCRSPYISKVVVWKSSLMPRCYCSQCWEAKHENDISDYTFDQFETVWNSGSTRLFNDIESANLYITKSLL